MNESTTEKKLIPPYLSFRTFLNFLERLKVGVPSHIDRSVMEKISGAVQNQLFTTLKYLQLINADNTPTEKLAKLVASEDEHRQKIMKEIVESSYSFLFEDGVDLKRITPHKLQELFDNAGASGGTTRKSMSFFMAAAKLAGIELSPHIKRITRIRVSGKSKRRIQNGMFEHELDTTEVPSPTKGIAQTWQQLLASKFPQFDPSWTTEVQEKWLTAFNRLIDQFKKTENEEEGEQS